MYQNEARYGAAIFSTIVYFVAFMAIIGFAPNAFSQSDPMPNEIKELKMGDSSAGVIKQISKSGTYSNEKSNDQGRPQLTWIPSDNANFKDLCFQFTEKDRLYLIRFNLKQAEKDQIQALKKSFFDSQKFLWDEPLKMKVKDNDILLYIKETGPDCFFDFFNRKTGERAFELFNRAVSVEDRPQKAPDQKPDNQKPDQSSVEGGESQTNDLKPDQEKGAVSEGQPVSEKIETQPKKESE